MLSFHAPRLRERRLPRLHPGAADADDPGRSASAMSVVTPQDVAAGGADPQMPVNQLRVAGELHLSSVRPLWPSILPDHLEIG